MNHTTNRLEDNWEKIIDLIKTEWPEVSNADLEYIDKEYDRLVSIIRQRYGGRKEIIQEAAIRDQINAILKKASH